MDGEHRADQVVSYPVSSSSETGELMYEDIVCGISVAVGYRAAKYEGAGGVGYERTNTFRWQLEPEKCPVGYTFVGGRIKQDGDSSLYVLIDEEFYSPTNQKSAIEIENGGIAAAGDTDWAKERWGTCVSVDLWLYFRSRDISRDTLTYDCDTGRLVYNVESGRLVYGCLCCERCDEPYGVRSVSRAHGRSALVRVVRAEEIPDEVELFLDV